LTNISKHDEPLTYSQLQNIIHEGKADAIQRVTMTNGESIIQVKMAGSDRDKAVTVPSESKEDLIKEFNTAGIMLDIKEPDKSSFWFG
ncbi:hypothetical protein ABTF02_18325, partial [Acinetobacter baumannii]